MFRLDTDNKRIKTFTNTYRLLINEQDRQYKIRYQQNIIQL